MANILRLTNSSGYIFQDYNYIEHLGERSFAPVSPRRLYLGHNRISEMDNHTFDGLENILELVRTI